jgi:peptidyl-prolyl cis-trans isomerase A (cyclophilin A)
MKWLPLLILLVACGEEKRAPSETAADTRSPLEHPELANATAPAKFRARFETTKGSFVIESERAWAPHGVDRLYNLIRIGYFRDTPFYRFVQKRGLGIIQFGFSWSPKVNAAWTDATIPADPAKLPNFRGYISFGMRNNRADSRTCQLFINLQHNGHLDSAFAPVARIVEGWDTIQKLNYEYLESPQQPRIANEGLAYLEKEFPRLDYIKKAEIID